MYDHNAKMSLGQMQAQQVGQLLQGTAGLAAMNAPPTPPTLMRALSRSDELNSRLIDLSNAVHEIATAIGGPWPCDTAAQCGKLSPEKPPVMEVLNDRIDVAHGKVSDIEGAIQAIRRTLGA